MIASELRENARKSLIGKWGKAALITLCFMVVEFAMSFILGIVSGIPFLGFLCEIAFLILTIPLSYGLIVSFMKLKRGETVECFDFFTIATSNIGRTWGIYGNIILKILPVFIILVIAFTVSIFCAFQSFTDAYSYGIYGVSHYSGGAGIIGLIASLVILGCSIYLIPKVLLYSLSYFLLYDRPELSGKELVEESARLMVGHRWSLVWLELTFFGWIILAAFTFGIGYLWLIPYMMVAMVAFYESLANVPSKTKEEKQEVSDTTEEQNPISEN